MIRVIEKDDISNLYELRKNVLPEIDEQMHYSEINDLLCNTENYCVYIKVIKDKIVGVIEASIQEFTPGCHTSPVCRIDIWYVESKFRNKGIGKKLVMEVEKWAKNKECMEVASIVDMKNTESIKIHKKLGYNETSLDDIGINFIKEIGMEEKYFGYYDVTKNYIKKNKLCIILVNEDMVAIENIENEWYLPFSMMRERECFETSIKNRILDKYGYLSKINKFICKASEYYHDMKRNRLIKEEVHFYKIIIEDKILNDVNSEFTWVQIKKAINKLKFSNEAWALTEINGDMICI